MTEDLAPWRDSAEQDLLVLTDGYRRGRHGLTLPFREATVAEEGISPGWTEITGMYDTVVIERSDVDSDRLAAAARAGLDAMRHDGHLIVTLGAPSGALDGPAGGWLDDLHWCGTTTLGGHPYAVLSRAEHAGGASPSVTAARFAAAAATVGMLATTPDAAGLRTTVGRHLEQRRRSEQALLGHLESLLTGAPNDRRRSRLRQRVVSTLRRHPAGRALLRMARRIRAAAR